MVKKKQIREMERWRSSGWVWQEYDKYSNTWVTYHTNGNGNGVFRKDKNGKSKQLLNPKTYHLSEKKSNAYAKIRRDRLNSW